MNWEAIKTEYITTDTSYRKLSVKYSISRATITLRAKREGWVALKNQFNAETMAKTQNAIVKDRAKRADRLYRAADKLLDMIEKRMDAPEFIAYDTQSYRHIASCLKDIKDIHSIKTDAEMREQEARIKNLEKQAEQEDTAREVTVTIAGGEDSWQK